MSWHVRWHVSWHVNWHLRNPGSRQQQLFHKHQLIPVLKWTPRRVLGACGLTRASQQCPKESPYFPHVSLLSTAFIEHHCMPCTRHSGGHSKEGTFSIPFPCLGIPLLTIQNSLMKKAPSFSLQHQVTKSSSNTQWELVLIWRREWSRGESWILVYPRFCLMLRHLNNLKVRYTLLLGKKLERQ